MSLVNDRMETITRIRTNKYNQLKAKLIALLEELKASGVNETTLDQLSELIVDLEWDACTFSYRFGLRDGVLLTADIEGDKHE